MLQAILQSRTDGLFMDAKQTGKNQTLVDVIRYGPDLAGGPGG